MTIAVKVACMEAPVPYDWHDVSPWPRTEGLWAPCEARLWAHRTEGTRRASPGPRSFPRWSGGRAGKCLEVSRAGRGRPDRPVPRQEQAILFGQSRIPCRDRPWGLSSPWPPHNGTHLAGTGRRGERLGARPSRRWPGDAGRLRGQGPLPPPSPPRARPGAAPPCGPASPRPPLGSAGGKAPSEAGSLHKPLLNCGVRARARARARVPTARRAPDGPRRLPAPLLARPALREQRPASPRPLPREDRPRRRLERRGDPGHASTPAPRGALARRRLAPQRNRRCRLGRRRAPAEYSHCAGWRGDLVGKDARVRAGERTPTGSARAAASEGRPLPSGRGPAAAAGPAPSREPRPPPAPPRPASARPSGRPPHPRPAPSPPLCPPGAIGFLPETNAKRRGNPSTKVSCDILLMALIYSKSSLDWNDQLAARNALWSKLSHSLLQDGYHIFIRRVFCNENQQGVERSVINALLQKEGERSSSILWRGKNPCDSH